jgi:signal transduction histidine kinase
MTLNSDSCTFFVGITFGLLSWVAESKEILSLILVVCGIISFMVSIALNVSRKRWTDAQFENLMQENNEVKPENRIENRLKNHLIKDINVNKK